MKVRITIRKLFLIGFKKDYLRNWIPSKKFKKIFDKLKTFIIEFPWYSKEVHNWYSLFLIFFNIKKNINIKFTNGFVFINANKENWHFFKSIIHIQEKDKSIKFLNYRNRYIAKIDNLFMFFNEDYEGIMLLHEDFFQDAYNRFNYENKVVIDIGGFIGDSTFYFIHKGARRVFVYEPNKFSYDVLSKNIKFNKLENKVTAFNLGVGYGVNPTTLYIYYNQASSSIFVDDSKRKDFVDKKNIQLISIKEILKEPIDILKMDCEGCEYHVLEIIIKENLIAKIREGIIFEVHNIDERRNVKYILELLEKLPRKKIYVEYNNKPIPINSLSNSSEFIYTIIVLLN